MTLLTLLSGTNSNEKVGLISPLLPLSVSSGNVWKSGPLPFTMGALAPAVAGLMGPIPLHAGAVPVTPPTDTPSSPGGGEGGRVWAGDEKALAKHLESLKETKLDDELAEVIAMILGSGILN